MKHRYDCLNALTSLGIDYEDAVSLRRISMTLHRWHEMECGTDYGYVKRENEDGTGKPHWVSTVGHSDKYRSWPIPDRETGALKRLGKIMAKYQPLRPYVQTDPRGAALYILRSTDVPEGASDDAYYSRGVVIYK